MKNYKKILVIMMILAVVPVFSACQKNDEQSAEQSDFIELSQDVIKENKIETLSVIEKPVTTTINTNGEIKTDEDKFYSVSSMIMGRITKSPVKLGDYVHAGQVLAYIQNPEITRIKFLLCRIQLDIGCSDLRTQIDNCRRNFLQSHLFLLLCNIDTFFDFTAKLNSLLNPTFIGLIGN